MAIQKDRVIKWAICFILAIGILLIPESDIVTWQMKMFLALTVFDILLIVFDLVDLLIAGLFLPTLLVVFNVTDTATAFSGWTNTTIYLLVGAYALSYALMDCGLLKRLSLIIVNAFGGSFNKMLYGVFFAGMVMGYLTFGNHQALLLTFAYGICVALNFEHTKESMVLMMVAGIGCLTVRSMMYYPTLHSIMTQQAQQVDPNFVINWYNPIIWAWPILFFCLGFIWLLTKMYKTKNYEFLGGKEYLQSELANMGKMSTAEKRAAIIDLPPVK